MRHPEEIKNWGQESFLAAQVEHEKLQKDIKVADSHPWKALSFLMGIVQFSPLTVIAVINVLFKFARPDDLDRALSNLYFYVPEMAVQKKLELARFIECNLVGEGIDLGCGSGVVGGLLIKYGKLDDLDGLDLNAFNKDNVVAAGYSNFCSADLSSIPLETDRFDYAISICVFEHVEKMFEAFSEVRRVLRNGGNFIFTTPSPNYATSHLGYRIRKALGLSRSAVDFARRRDLISLHAHIYSDQDWREILESSGFKNIRISTFFSEKQSIWYDVLNWQTFFPWLYSCGKMQVLGFRFPLWKRFSSWTVAHVVALLTRPNAGRGKHTHLLIQATVQKEIIR